MVEVKDAWAQSEVADRAAGTEAELGWVLHPDYIGQGYATEAVRRVLELCFVDLDVRPRGDDLAAAPAVTSPRAASRERGVMAAHGTRRDAPREARHGRVLHRDGESLGTSFYAMLREEWTPART